MGAHDEMSRRTNKLLSFGLYALQGDDITCYGCVEYKHAAFVRVNVLCGMDRL